MVLCYDDYIFTRPNRLIKWIIRIHLCCLYGFNNIKKIQTEKIFNNDMKSIKYIKYYVILYDEKPSSYTHMLHNEKRLCYT